MSVDGVRRVSDGVPGTQGYPAIASRMLENPLEFDAVHKPYLDLIPGAPASILDVGSGPGHDAAELARRGHRVVACEPTPELLYGARERYRDLGVLWVADHLPGLEVVRQRSERFDFVLVSGVWSHVPPELRPEAWGSLSDCLAPGGILAVSLRHGPFPDARVSYAVNADVASSLAEAAGLDLCRVHRRESLQAGNRAAGVLWTLLAFRRRRRARRVGTLGRGGPTGGRG